MAGFIKVQVEKLPVQQINTKINSEIFEAFQKKLKQQNIPMNVAIETFCRQYVDNKYNFIDRENILKWVNNEGETSVLNTPINKEVYDRFKDRVKAEGFYVKNVLSAFVEDYANNDMILEFAEK